MTRRVFAWISSRLNLPPVVSNLLDEPIPGGASWIYVFGSITLFLFILQALTGTFLALYYVPASDHAYDSVKYIQEEVPFGSFVRGLHHWGASAVMIVIGLHMLQVFLYGAYKRPRELMWIVGVVLLVLMLSFGFTGYLLPWDQKAYWATQVGINLIASIPLVGGTLARILRGGTELGALTLSRFFAVHALFLPWLTMALIGLHVFILRRVGPAGPWDEKKAKRVSEPFWPRQVFMDAVAIGFVFVIVAVLAIAVPAHLADRANPADNTFTPLPEWYFLFYYQLLKYSKGAWVSVFTFVLPVLFFALLFALPFLGRKSERAPVSRPVAISAGVLFLVAIFGLLGLAIKEHAGIKTTDPSVERGQTLYQELACSTCHRIHGEGGQVGPDLSYVGDERNREWIVEHFRDPQKVVPGSIMPPVRLGDKELEDLAAYMLSLKKN